MGLTYSSPQAFAQSLRQRHSASPSQTLVVVEGPSDVRAFSQYAAEQIHLVPAKGKEMVLGAFDALVDNVRSNILFIVDCDAEMPKSHLGIENIVVSQNRDLESDLFDVHRAGHAVIREYLAPNYPNVGELNTNTSSIVDYLLRTTSQFGSIMDAARTLRLRVRIQDPVSHKKRPIKMTDLPEIRPLLPRTMHITRGLILTALARELGWSEADADAVEQLEATRGFKLCRLHKTPDCRSCTSRLRSNGHALVELLTQILSAKTGIRLTEAEVARHLRLSATYVVSSTWHVTQRIRAFEASSGRAVLAQVAV